MGQSDSQRLKEINTHLIQLYLRLEQLDNQEEAVWKEINRLESEKEQLPHTMVYSDRAQQYVVILRSAASSLQLQRYSLQVLINKPNELLSPDEIRQKNILLNKFKTSEKKIETYRQKLADMGLLPFEIDDIVLEGYREQNQRFLQRLLSSLESTIKDYLDGYYHEHGTIPTDFLHFMTSWEVAENRKSLTSTQLRILELKNDCLRKGVPSVDVTGAIRSVTQWDEDKKQSQLNLLASQLEQEFKTLDAQSDKVDVVNTWMKSYDAGKRLTPSQTKIVTLIKDLQMYGVSQQKIDFILSPSTQDNSLLKSFKNRFRRKS